jgi:pantetheine-phosphate adenylyltransferase
VKTAVYPGSFDPITLGHVDVVERAASIFDRVVVAVSVNPQKSPLFTVEERVAMIRETFSGTPSVEVDSFAGLTVTYAESIGASSIIKGLRAISDFDSEFQQALFNRKLSPGITTLFLPTSFANVYLSSSLVKEVARFGGDVSFAVPPAVGDRLRARLSGEAADGPR